MQVKYLKSNILYIYITENQRQRKQQQDSLLRILQYVTKTQHEKWVAKWLAVHNNCRKAKAA